MRDEVIILIDQGTSLKENEVIRETRSAEKCYLYKSKEYKYKMKHL